MAIRRSTGNCCCCCDELRSFAQEPTPTEAATRLVGSPVYSSDAQKVGQVAAIDMSREGRITGLQAEIGGFLGLGSSSVHLGANEFKVER